MPIAKKIQKKIVKIQPSRIDTNNTKNNIHNQKHQKYTISFLITSNFEVKNGVVITSSKREIN